MELLDAVYEVLHDEHRPFRARKLAAVLRGRDPSHRPEPWQVYAGLLEDIAKGESRFVQQAGGFGLAEWKERAQTRREHPHFGGQSAQDEESLERVMKIWLRSLREANVQISLAPSANVLCVWTEICYRLDLKEDARKLFHQISAEKADPWLFRRAKNFYRLCQETAP
jgi:hypothetical protein